jgi:hypothetical protein
MAQKIHGMTLPPRDGKTNERFRDLLDVILLLPLFQDEESLAQACRDVFAARCTHSWPPGEALPAAWSEPYAALAREIGVVPTDFESAESEFRQLIARLSRTDDRSPAIVVAI